MPEPSDRNPLIEIAKKYAIDIPNIANLTRDEKISIRNQIVLALVGTNHSIPDVAKIFTVSQRTIYNILEESYQDAAEWYKQFPAKIRIAAFKINSAAVFTELERMKIIRDRVYAAGDHKLEFDMSKEIALLQIKYDKMLTEGATLDSIKSQADELASLAMSFDTERSKLQIQLREMKIELSHKESDTK